MLVLNKVLLQLIEQKNIQIRRHSISMTNFTFILSRLTYYGLSKKDSYSMQNESIITLWSLAMLGKAKFSNFVFRQTWRTIFFTHYVSCC